MLRELWHKKIKALVKDEEFYLNSLLRLPETKKAIFQSRPALYCKSNLFYWLASFMSFLKWLFLFNIGITYFELSLKKIVKKKEFKLKYKKRGVPLRGLNAMPFRTEARKCNHWATGGLLKQARKFNGTYIKVKCKLN